MPIAGPLLWNAAKGLNGGDFGSTQSHQVDEELFDNVYDEDEDVLVYSGEEYDAVINNNGMVQTDDEEFKLPNHVHDQLVGKAHEIGAYEQIIGLETEEKGQTDQHVYLGTMEDYSGDIDEHTEEVFEFSEFEEILEDNKDYMERLEN